VIDQFKDANDQYRHAQHQDYHTAQENIQKNAFYIWSIHDSSEQEYLSDFPAAE